MQKTTQIKHISNSRDFFQSYFKCTRHASIATFMVVTETFQCHYKIRICIQQLYTFVKKILLGNYHVSNTKTATKKQKIMAEFRELFHVNSPQGDWCYFSYRMTIYCNCVYEKNTSKQYFSIKHYTRECSFYFMHRFDYVHDDNFPMKMYFF